MLSDISKAFSRWIEVDGIGAGKVDEEFKPLVMEVAAPVREGEVALLVVGPPAIRAHQKQVSMVPCDDPSTPYTDCHMPEQM